MRSKAVHKKKWRINFSHANFSRFMAMFLKGFKINNYVVAAVFFLSFFLFFQSNLTGNVSLDIANDYFVGEMISGDLSLVLDEGEFIPAESLIVVNNGGQVNEFLLKDLVSRKSVSGNYNVEGAIVNGSGEGFGIADVIYPEVSFVLEIEWEVVSGVTEGEAQEEVLGDVNESDEEIEENVTKVVAEEGASEEVEEVLEEVIEVIEDDVEAEPVEVVEEEVEVIQSLSPMTGNVVSREIDAVEGNVKFGEEFVYEIKDGEKLTIKESSHPIELEIKNGQAVITTNYSEDAGGDVLRISLDDMDLVAKEGLLSISLIYQGETFVETTTEVSVNVKDEKLSLVVNETSVSNVVEVTKKYRVVVGRPVKWVKVLNTTAKDNVSVEIPKDAMNVSIKLGEEIDEALRDVEESEIEVESVMREQLEMREGGMTGMVSLSVDNEGSVFSKAGIRLFGVTGKVIEGDKIDSMLEEGVDEDMVVLDDVLESSNDSLVAVEYFTEAPTLSEVVNDDGKEVTISAPDELNYTEVLAFSVVEGGVKVSEKEKIKLIWNVNREDAVAFNYIEENSDESGVKREVEFEIYDDDYDGVIDYISWVVPHLSDQVYEIIYITKAELLDVNREVVRDVYDEVGEKDGVFLEVSDGEYLRVTFEKDLDKTKDITLYARATCQDYIIINDVQVPCEIYYKKLKIDEAEGNNE